MVSFNLFFSNSNTKLADGYNHQQSQQDFSSTGAVDRPIPEMHKETPQVDLHEAGPEETTPASPATVASSTTIAPGSGPTPRSFTLFQSRVGRIRFSHKQVLIIEREQRKERRVLDDLKHVVLSDAISSQSDKSAMRSAEIVRSLIVGTNTTSLAPMNAKPLSKTQLGKVKSDLSKPKSANKVISHLRRLDVASNSSITAATPAPKGPIHAVCLCASDEEVARTHFSRLEAGPNVKSEDDIVSHSVVTASLESVTSVLENLQVINLLSGDLGIGQPPDGEGILSGAIPTAEAIMKGIEAITPQLMSLGYATDHAMLPDHEGVYPPTDRISVLTYWWGFELVLPSRSISFLGKVKSVSHTLLTFLTTLAAVSEGVREVLPFVRYMSQFVEFEFDTIKRQDEGKGVVCAATWIMPVALVPRPWDFIPRAGPNQNAEPAMSNPVASKSDSTETSAPAAPPMDAKTPAVIQPTRPTVNEPNVGTSDGVV